MISNYHPTMLCGVYKKKKKKSLVGPVDQDFGSGWQAVSLLGLDAGASVTKTHESVNRYSD